MNLFKKLRKEPEMKLFFQNLTGKIEEAVRNDVEKALKELNGEKIYAAALVTDSDCITLYPALNTCEYMRKRDLEYIEILKDHLSEEQIRKLRDGTSSVTRWVPDDWGYPDNRDSDLIKISELLYAKEKSNPKEYAKHIDSFFEAVTSAFKNLIETKAFGEASETITCFISMSDDERAPAIENFSAKLLNSEAVYEAFLKRSYDI